MGFLHVPPFSVQLSVSTENTNCWYNSSEIIAFSQIFFEIVEYNKSWEIPNAETHIGVVSS